jgi:glycosyltransferase involved in cell wall biosynthesis
MTAPAPRAGVSILMPTYNGARYLAEQLDSIVAQAAPEDEVIVLDDGSSDATCEIVAGYAERFPFVTALRNERNLGVRGTVEKLLGLATRDVVFLSDQDDIWVEGRKTAMVEALRRDGSTAVLANALVMTERGIERPFFAAPPGPDVRSVLRNYAKNSFIGCCMAFRRDLLAVALPFPPTISMHDWWIGTCAMATGRVTFLPEPSLLYRRHATNQSSSARRPWRVVLKDRRGNLLALAALPARLLRWRRQAG